MATLRFEVSISQTRPLVVEAPPDGPPVVRIRTGVVVTPALVHVLNGLIAEANNEKEDSDS